MIVFEILASFRNAALLSFDIIEEDSIEEGAQTSGDGSGQNYHSPAMENSILPPYNFNFI